MHILKSISLVRESPKVKHGAKVVVASRSPDCDTYFYFCCNKQIYAHVYKRKRQWYIWYPIYRYRIRATGFCDAITFLESEVMRCVEL